MNFPIISFGNGVSNSIHNSKFCRRISRIEMTAGEKRWFKWSLLVIYTGTVVFLAMHHEPWWDEYHVWRMSFDLSFGQIFSAMQKEGHFCLWHYLVAVIVKLFGMDWHALFFVSVPLMVVAVWIILFRVDFPIIGKIFLVFSAPFLYSFPVISRCYALIPPIVAELVMLCQRHKHPLTFCTLLGLLANTHAYMEGFVAVLWLLFVYRRVMLIWNVDRMTARRNLCYSVVTLFFVLLAFVQVIGAIIIPSENGLVFNHSGKYAFTRASTIEEWCRYFYGMHKFWRIPDTLVLYILEIIIVFFVVRGLKPGGDRRGMVLIISFGTLWQVLFHLLIYNMYHQRVYLILIPIIFVLALATKSSNRCLLTVFMAVLWLLDTPRRSEVWRDISSEYIIDTRSAREVDDILPENANILITENIYFIQSSKRHCVKLDGYDETLFPSHPEMLSGYLKGGDYLISETELDTSRCVPGIRFSEVYSGAEGCGQLFECWSKKKFTVYRIDTGF